MSFGFTSLGEIVPLELLLATLLLVAFTFRDRYAWIARWAAAGLLVWIGGVLSASHEYILGEPDWLVSSTHLLLWTAIALACARYFRWSEFYIVAAVDVATWSALAIVNCYRFLQPRVAGLREISLGLAFFALAFLFSVWKTRRMAEIQST